MTRRRTALPPTLRHLTALLRPATVGLIATVAFASCFHGERAPTVTPRNTLGLGELSESNAHVSDQPFGVVFASPQGETKEATEITLVFNRPMRPLSLAGDEAPAPVRMTPEIPGAWRWVGTSGLYFAPKDPLPRATSFEVTVPAETRALDGSTLGKPHTIRFSTARPALVNTSPWDGTTGLRPETGFELRFNQPIADAELRRAVSLSVGKAKNTTVPFDLNRPDPANPKLVKLKPRTALPLDSAIRLSVDASLRGTEGPLTAGTASTMSYQTYGPLRMREMYCQRDTPHGKCAPRSSLSLSFTNAVSYADARKLITVTPAVKLAWWEGAGDDYKTQTIRLDAPFGPARTYTIRVRGTLKDQYGQSLGRDEVMQVTFDDLWPQAEIGVQGTYFEPKAARDIAVASINVKALDLLTVPLDDDGIGLFSWSRQTPTFEQIARLTKAQSSRVHPAAAPNLMAKQLVRPSQVLGGANKRGPMAVAIRYTSRPGSKDARAVTQTQVVQLTDLGISAKLSRWGSLVWVNRLSDGKPVAGAEVRVRQANGSSPGDYVVKTDHNGMVLVPGDKLYPARAPTSAPLIIVRDGEDWAYRSSSEMLYGWRYGVSTDVFGDMTPFGMVFTERGVYRPGDTVRIKGVLRRPDSRGTKTPAGESAEVKVTTPMGDTLSTKAIALTEFGTFSMDAKIPATAKLGGYEITVRVGAAPEYGAHAYGSFDVAEYRPSEFKVGVETDKRAYVRGDSARCTARGDYLFGAPMVNAKLRTTITRAPTWFVPPKTDGFTTSDTAHGQDRDEDEPGSSRIQGGDSRLDALGKASVETSLAMPGQRGTELVTCEAEVMDLSRQTVASASTALVHPASFYVAVRSGEDGFARGGDELSPEVLTVDPEGRRQSGVPVDLELVHRSWVTARESAGTSGLHTVSRVVDNVVSQCSVRSAAAPASCKLRVPKAGYYILRARAKDSRGNPVAASRFVYALGDGESGWSERDDNAIELVPDKQSYEVGQTARVLVKSPFREAEALVTIERAGIYEHKRMRLAGSMPTIQVPITQDFQPNAYVSVVLIRGRSKAPPPQWNAPDVGAPAFRIGYASLRVNPEARRLAVTVTPDKSDYRPGEPTTVNLQVKDRTGKGARAEITLYAVDEGVLMLTGYKTPDPIPIFTEPRPLRVGYSEARTELARLTLSPFQSTVGEDKGLEGGGGGDARKDFRQSAYFNPSIVTDAEGRAQVSFRLPESLTTYRLMTVVVAQDDRFGFGEARVTTSLPLMARPAFPRLVRAGDTIEAGVVVTSKTLPKSAIEVRAVSDGLTLLSAAQQTIELDQGQSKEVRFTFRGDAVGNAKLRFHVEGGGERDTVEFGKPVKAPAVMEAAALYGSTKSAAGEQLGDLAKMRSDVGGLEVSVASTALVGLGGSVEQLVEYPYECTEQLVSRLVPLIPLRELARAYNLPLPKDADRFITTTVAKIVRRQRHDGGFGYWDDSPQSSPWVTAYALWGLGLAKRNGAQLPASTLDNATRYVRRYLEHYETSPYGLETATFMVDVLAENGTPDPGYMTRLFEKRDKLPLFSKALLTHAIAIGKGDTKARDTLMSDLEGHIRVQGNQAVVAENVGNAYAELMDSTVRTQALVLRSLMAARPNHPLGERLARGILGAREGGTWRNTQESAYALLALDDYRKAQESEPPSFVASVWMGNDRLLRQPMMDAQTKAQTATIPAARLHKSGGSTLAFQMEEDKQGTLFYEARIRYARKELPTQPMDRGFYVQKTMRVVTPDSLAQSMRSVPSGVGVYPSPRGGELVLVDLLVVSPQPHQFVVIDDPIPAGLEAVDSRLATSAGSLDVPGTGGEDESLDAAEDAQDYDDRIARGSALLPSWFRQELRDDRVLFFVDHMAAGMYHYRYLARATTVGQFTVPPTKAEAMYQPEIFGRTAAAWFRVQP